MKNIENDEEPNIISAAQIQENVEQCNVVPQEEPVGDTTPLKGSGQS